MKEAILSLCIRMEIYSHLENWLKVSYPHTDSGARLINEYVAGPRTSGYLSIDYWSIYTVQAEKNGHGGIYVS